MICKFIGMEDLVANALIELLEKADKKMVTFNQLTAYGIRVISILQSKKEKAVLLLSKQYTAELIRNYSDVFYVDDDNCYISIKDGIDAKVLRERFRAYASIELMLAYTDISSLRALGIIACRIAN